MASTVIHDLEQFGPDRCDRLGLSEASDYTRRLAESQYENFTVVSRLLPRRLRDHFRHIYAFCRWADDLGDETGDTHRSLELLDWWRRELDLCYAGEPRHPVFVALRHTVEALDIPRKPFDDLIDAFVQDQTVTRYDTWEQVLDYCTRSADPVGRLVLYACGYRDEARQRLSDRTCTALQLANFWQDVRRDVLERDRVYIPADVAGKHGLSVPLMVAAIRADAARRSGVNCASCVDLPDPGVRGILPAYRATVKELVDRTRPLFAEGRQLWPLVAADIRLDIKLFGLGGERVLKMIERRGYDTLTGRPRLGKLSKAMLMLRAAAWRLTPSRGERAA